MIISVMKQSPEFGRLTVTLILYVLLLLNVPARIRASGELRGVRARSGQTANGADAFPFITDQL